MSDEPKYVIYQIPDGSQALYIDGTLDLASGEDDVADRLRELLGAVVREVPSEALFLGSAERDMNGEVAGTVEEIEAWIGAEAQKNHEAEALRIKAAELIRQADELEGK